MKTKTIPFDLETAKKIQAGEIEGKIKTRNLRYECTIVEYCVYSGYTCQDKLLLVKFPAHDFEEEKLEVYHYDGRYMSKEYGENWFDLVLEVPDKPQFKPFDRVLVSQDGWHYWIPSLYRNETPDGKHICIDNLEYDKCIPYDGNQELVGTTDKPKEE